MMEFIKLPIMVRNRNEVEQAQDLGLDEGRIAEEESSVWIRYNDIESFYPSSDQFTGQLITSVFLKSGEAYSIYLDIDTFLEVCGQFEKTRQTIIGHGIHN